VQLTGPATLQAGESGMYTLTIMGGAAVAGGLDAALDDDALAAGAHLGTVSASTKLLGGEVTHTAPVGFTAGSLSFQFAVVAPASARTMTLYVAGNSTNQNGSDTGDKAAATTMSIEVAGPPAPAPSPGADLSGVTNPPGEASDLAIAPSPSGRDLTTPAGDPGSAGPPAGVPSNGARSQGGCVLAGARPNGGVGGMGALAMLVMLAIAARARRRALRACARRAPPAPSASGRERARR
jgi:hypothetical protein